MKIKPLISSFIIWIFICFRVSAQYNSSTVSKTLLPHSPDAEAFGKFGDIPVGLYTGIPNISIPIYEMKLKSLSIPITLDYHSSGVKVDELASTVGLDWALNVGGMINQIVYGNSDLGGGWLNAGNNRTPVNGPIQTDFNSIINYNENAQYNFNKFSADGVIDTQPDIFSFSMPGHSGKFFFDQDKNVRLMPLQNLKVELNYTGTLLTGFTITDESGNIFYFLTGENTVTNVTGCSTNVTGNPPSQMSGSLYLTKIITPKQEEVDFVYTSASYTIQNQIQESRYWYSNVGLVDTAHFNPMFNCITTSTSTVSGLRLSYIKNMQTGEKVTFSYATADRLDLPGSQCLSAIDVINSNNAVIKHFSLSQDYFVSVNDPSITAPTNYRLRLTSVTKAGEQPYLFTYNNTALPPRLSFEQDHWGYYNGIHGNTTLLPAENSEQFPTGANREADSVFMKAGVLTKIVYPTGGSASFTYEGNDHHVNGVRRSWLNGGAGGSAGLNISRVFNFTVKDSSVNFLANWITSDNGNTGGQIDPNGNNTEIVLTGPDNYYVNFVGNNPTSIPFHGNTADGYGLKPGNYTITVTNTNTGGSGVATGGISITWKYPVISVINQNELCGGLRIKSITTVPVNGLPVTKHFEYADLTNPALSSGIVQFVPSYDNDFYTYQLNPTGSYMDQNGSVHTSYHLKQADYKSQSSGSLTPLGTMLGGSVVYSNVNVYDNDKTNGYVSNQFSHADSGPYNGDQPTVSPFPPAIVNDWLNGLPVITTTYKYNRSTNLYFPISESKNIYKTSIGDGSAQYNDTGLGVDPTENYVRGIKITYQYPEWNGVATDPNFFASPKPALFFVGYYHLYSSWFHPVQSINTVYDQNGLNPVVDTVSYYYDNPSHLQLTRTVTTKSNGKIVTALSTYPDDYASGTEFIDDMKVNHLTGLPIEQVNYQKDITGTGILNGTIKQYQTGGKGLLDKIYGLETTVPISAAQFKLSDRAMGDMSFGTLAQAFSMDARYRPRLSYDSYDGFGNPLQVTEVNGASTTYLWSYNKKYPIAVITNATYTAVESALGGFTNVDNFSNQVNPTKTQVDSYLAPLKSALPNAQVMNYTFIPSVGMTSSTDAKGITSYYEYDSFMRLMNIKDKDGNIVKHIDYHYQNQ